MIKRIDHIGVVGKEFEPTVERLKALGFVCSEIVEAKEVGAKMAFFDMGNTTVEYISFAQPEKLGDPLIDLMVNQKGAINHICLEVEDLDEAVRHFQRNGADLVEGCPRTGPHGRIAFFRPDTTGGIFIELRQA